MLNQTYEINENKINNWLNELDNDRKKIFDEVKNSKSNDKNKENKILCLQQIQQKLLNYKKILINENENK